MKFNITNKQNQKGYHLPTYGNAIIVDSRLLKVTFITACILTLGTNWLIPIFVNKIKDIKIRYGG